MALVRDPVAAGCVGSVMTLAHASWRREELDATWLAAGWRLPAGGSAERSIFDNMEYAFDDARIAISMRFDPDAIKGFMVTYAVLATEDGPDAADLLTGLPAGWMAEPDAGGERLDEVWAAVSEAVAGVLGAPARTGRHGAAWSHALWRAGERLVINLQGEDPPSYGVFDAAYLWVVDHPASEETPEGEAVYDLLMG